MKTLSLILAFFLMPHLVAQICNAASVFPASAFNPDAVTLSLEPTPNTLSDLLTHPDCASVCWLGIDQSTTEAEVIDILDANNIQYVKHTYSLDSNLIDYTVTGGYTHPYIYPGFRDAIIIWIGKDLSGESRVAIWLALNNISVLDVIKEFGAPTHILQDTSYESNFELVYLERGLVFSAYDDDLVGQVSLTSPDHIVSAYINDPFSKALTGCTEAMQLCAVVTATSVP